MREKLKIHDGDTPGKVIEVKLEYPKPKVATMSKDIWHKPSETPRNYSDIIEHHKANDYDNHTLIEQYDIWATGGSPVNPFDKYTIRWAYVEDFLALENELYRTRKALDVAVDALKDNLSQANFTQMLDASRFHCIRTKCELAIEQITALEQKD